MLKAFKIFKNKTETDLTFVLVLQILDRKYYSEIKNFIKNNFRQNEIIIITNLQSTYLVNIYKNSSFYIFSSYCEVFGFTSLEAMSQDCPVLISNKSALLEINGNAALYFDPDDENEISVNMEKIMFDKNLRHSLIMNGQANYIKYSWEKTVQETLYILN